MTDDEAPLVPRRLTVTLMSVITSVYQVEVPCDFNANDAWHHADLPATHAAADGANEGARAGWVGASAAALQAMMAHWQATTTQLCGDIASHGAAYRSAANAYTANDGNSAEALDRTI
jgi:uncharacterized protein YukE